MRVRHAASRLEEGIIGFLLVGTTLLVFLEVVLRFGFGEGLLWIQELTLHMAAWLVLFGASWGVKTGAHIGVDALVRLFPPALKRIVSAVAVLLCLVYCGLFGYGAWVYLDKIYTIGIGMEDVRIPIWIARHIPADVAEFLRIENESVREAAARGIDPHLFTAPAFPLWLFHSVLLLGFILLGIRFLEILWALYTGRATGFHLADEAREVLETLEHEDDADADADAGHGTGGRTAP